MMPPPTARKPGGDTLLALVEALEATIDKAARPNPGSRTFQRLNRPEYERAVRDLLGVQVNAGDFLPLDTKSANFDNIADVQSLSPTLLDAYLNAASAVSRMAVGDKAAPAIPVTYRQSPFVSQHPWDHVDGTPYGTRGGIVATHTFPADGIYTIRVNVGGGIGTKFEDIDVSVGVDHSSLAATLAIADFGIEERVRLVPVRILEQIGLELRIRAASDVVLAGPPRVCLVGPHWAPDDAGLSDRCWGDPDLGALVGSQLASDADGHPRLDEDVPIEVIATIARGHERCDYPVGTWSLEVAVEPIVDGRPEGSFQLPDTQFDVSLEPAGTALRLVARGDSRYCGLAQSVWREQGEPSLIAP